MPDAGSALEMRGVEKQYGALRPLRIRDLRIPLQSRTALIGLDQPAAEMFVNLSTGAALPDAGDVRSLGQPTAGITDGDAWLVFMERFGFVSPRIVLLEGMTIAQNLAIPFDLDLDPIPPGVMSKVHALADELDIERKSLTIPVAETAGLLRAQVWLARALALTPELLMLEHPTAAIPSGDVSGYARLIAGVSERRHLTTIALTMDEKFGKEIGGRILKWEPATGELRERRRWF